MTSPKLSITEIACGFVANLRLEDVPSSISTKIKYHILDTIGCGIAGAGTTLGKQYVEITDIEHRTGIVPVLGTNKSYGPAASAFVNSGAMNALDCDDGFEINGRGMGHPGASIIAAALSGIFGTRHVCGKHFITGVIASYEVNNRLILAIQPSIERFRLVYGVCQHQSIPSALAYAYISGEALINYQNILGLAGTLANVPSLRKYNFTERPIVSFKDFNAPAAEIGVRAVQLSQCGFRGSVDVLGGNSGLWRMLGSDQFDELLFTHDLSEKWYIERNAFKAFPACRWMQTCLDAYEKTATTNQIDPEDVTNVKVFTSSGMLSDFMIQRPCTMVDAQFSLPFSMACVALQIAPFKDWFTEEALHSEKILNFASRVEAIVDDEIDMLMQQQRRPVGRVEINTRKGLFSSELISYASGCYENPMLPSAIEKKFLSNVEPIIGSKKAQQMLERLLEIEKVKDMRDLINLAVPSL